MPGHTLTTQPMHVAGSALWVCASALYTILTTTNHLRMGFSEHLPVTGLLPFPSQNFCWGIIRQVFFFFFHFYVRVVYVCIHVYFACVSAHMCGCAGIWVCAHVKACSWCQELSSISSTVLIKAGLSNPELANTASATSQLASGILSSISSAGMTGQPPCPFTA